MVELGGVDVDGREILNEGYVGRSIVVIEYKMMRMFERMKLDGLLKVESLGVVGVRKWVHFENLDLSIRDLLVFCPFLVFLRSQRFLERLSGRWRKTNRGSPNPCAE
jgi:hypothetical protein